MDQFLIQRQNSINENAWDEGFENYGQVRKLIENMRLANQAETRAVLEQLLNFDLAESKVQEGLNDSGGFKLLTNLLKCKDYHCNKLALSILEKITLESSIQNTIVELGAIPNLILYLEQPIAELQASSALIISQIARSRIGRDEFQKTNGIDALIKLSDMPVRMVVKSEKLMTKQEKDRMSTLICTVKALYALSYSAAIKQILFEKGIIRIICNLIQAKNLKVVEYTMGLLQNCADEDMYQKAIGKEDIIRSILKRLNTKNAALKELSVRAIFKSCDGALPRELVFKHKGTDQLVDLLGFAADDKRLLASITGAIWKSAKFKENLKALMKKGVFSKLIQLITIPYQDEEVLVNTVGALAELCQLTENKRALIVNKSETIKFLKNFLHQLNTDLLVNTCLLIGECAKDTECINEVTNNDFVRLVWSLLKNPSPEVQASAAWALIPCIRNAQDSGEMVRSFVGAIELTIRMLSSSDTNVLGHSCAAIAEIATDKQNVAILTQLGVLPILTDIISKNTGFIMMNASLAIVQCCKWENNCYSIGRMGIVVPLVNHLKKSKMQEEKAAVIKALRALSADYFNCITMHKSGAVLPLLEANKMINDREIQEDIANCLLNIRRLALLADSIKYRGRDYCDEVKSNKKRVSI